MQTLKQEPVVLSSFTHDDAWQMGQIAHQLCAERKLAVAVCIEKCGQVVFQCGMEGSTPDNDRWMAGKRSVVRLTHRPSLYGRERLEAKGGTAETAFGLDSKTFLFSGGSVPITVKGVGVIGSITVSGLKDTDDHALAMEILQDFYNHQR